MRGRRSRVDGRAPQPFRSALERDPSSCQPTLIFSHFTRGSPNSHRHIDGTGVASPLPTFSIALSHSLDPLLHTSSSLFSGAPVFGSVIDIASPFSPPSSAGDHQSAEKPLHCLACYRCRHRCCTCDCSSMSAFFARSFLFFRLVPFRISNSQLLFKNVLRL